MLNERIKKLRKSQNLTLAEFAKLAETSPGYISDIEKAPAHKQKNIGADFIITLKRNYKNKFKKEINLDWLLYGEGSMFLEDQPTGQKYPELIRTVEKSGMSEEEAVKIIQMYSTTSSQKSFDLLMKASKGDKEAVNLLLKYLEGLKVVSD